jgi:hypothetical protein
VVTWSSVYGMAVRILRKEAMEEPLGAIETGVVAGAEDPITGAGLVFYSIIVTMTSAVDPSFRFGPFGTIRADDLVEQTLVTEMHRRIIRDGCGNFDGFRL